MGPIKKHRCLRVIVQASSGMLSWSISLRNTPVELQNWQAPKEPSSHGISTNGDAYPDIEKQGTQPDRNLHGYVKLVTDTLFLCLGAYERVAVG